MRRILLTCATLAALTVPAVAVARGSASARPGFLVVRKAAGDGGVNGRPVATIIVRGFVLGRVSREGQVKVFQLASVNGQGAPQVTAGVATRDILWHRLRGKEFRGSNFRFRAVGGRYRVVVRGSGIYLFAGGHGHVKVLGSSVYTHADGKYSVDGRPFRSLPARPLKRTFGGG